MSIMVLWGDDMNELLRHIENIAFDDGMSDAGKLLQIQSLLYQNNAMQDARSEEDYRAFQQSFVEALDTPNMRRIWVAIQDLSKVKRLILDTLSKEDKKEQDEYRQGVGTGLTMALMAIDRLMESEDEAMSREYGEE
jgi:hypothetical protein